MKQFLAFYGWFYYPSGGMDDFIGDFNSLGDAIKSVKKQKKKDGEDFTTVWGHVWDSKHKKIVWKSPVIYE